MATFADLSTLLLTFFVLMLSMSSVDVIKFKALLGSMQDAFGVKFENVGDFQAVLNEDVIPSKEPGKGEWQDVPPDSLGDDINAGEAELARMKEVEKHEREEAVKQIKEVIDKSKLGDLAEVQSGEQGIRLRVKGALLFDPGEAYIRGAALPFLDSLIEVLRKFDYYLLVEGHTDSSPISTAQFPSNWELSSYRASTVLRYLIANHVDPRRLTSVGLAENYPLANNDTPEGRAANRRVEFVLTKKPFRPEIN
jgi:chemotaxis protein MotB